jgi:hypothetical protein
LIVCDPFREPVFTERIAPLLALAGYAAGYFVYDYFDRNHRGWFSDAVGFLMGYENIQQDAWKLSDLIFPPFCGEEVKP